MFITKDVITEEGITKKQFYQIIGRQSPDFAMVDTIEFIGERTKEELEAQVAVIQAKIDLFI